MPHDFLLEQCKGFLLTPPLWVNEQFGVRQFDFPKVELNAFEPMPIPKNIRLGHQMEHICKQLIEYSDDYEMVMHNLPIKDGKRTLGEIDFILKEVATEKMIHVELTYKFYIVNPEISEPIHRLMGPNKRDMFFTKMEKIKNEQFALLHSEEGSTALLKNNINVAKVSHQACYKTQLFIPFGDSSVYIRPLNQNCICGYWLHFDDFDSKEFTAADYYIPFKSEWVINPHGNVPWRSHFEILMDINLRMLKENAPMVWMKKSDDEFEKFFVVWW